MRAQQASAEVANRVCTTERSSAKSSTIERLASDAGVASSAVITVEVAPSGSRSSRRRISVVVPLRLIAST